MSQEPENGPEAPGPDAGTPPAPDAPPPPPPPAPGYGYPAPNAPQYPNPYPPQGYPQAYPPGYPPPGYWPSYGPPPTNEKAIWSLVLGIVGLVFFFCFGGIASIPAIALGHQARQEIDRSGGRQSGRGQADAGFIMGIIGAIVLVIWFLFVIAFDDTGDFSNL